MEYKKVVEHRSELMGIALITIILFHWGSVHKYYDAYNFVSGIFSSYIGSIGVDVFLFLSGVGIYSSLQRNSLRVYFKNRVTRILPAYLSIGGGFWFIKDLLLQHVGIWKFVKDVLLLSFWTDGEDRFWYIALSIILYFLAPMLATIIKHRHGFEIALVCSLSINTVMSMAVPIYFDMIEVAMRRIPVFLLGMEIARKIQIEERVSPLGWICCIVAVVLKISKHLFHIELFTRYVNSLFGIALCFFYVLCLQSKRVENLSQGLRSGVDYLGKVSLEMYLVHVSLIWICVYFTISMINPFNYALMILFSVAISVLLHALFEKIKCNN